MTDKIAIYLAVIISLLVIWDVVQNDVEYLTFLGRKALDLLDIVIFWR